MISVSSDVAKIFTAVSSLGQECPIKPKTWMTGNAIFRTDNETTTAEINRRGNYIFEMLT